MIMMAHGACPKTAKIIAKKKTRKIHFHFFLLDVALIYLFIFSVLHHFNYSTEHSMLFAWWQKNTKYMHPANKSMLLPDTLTNTRMISVFHDANLLGSISWCALIASFQRGRLQEHLRNEKTFQIYLYIITIISCSVQCIKKRRCNIRAISGSHSMSCISGWFRLLRNLELQNKRMEREISHPYSAYSHIPHPNKAGFIFGHKMFRNILNAG